MSHPAAVVTRREKAFTEPPTSRIECVFLTCFNSDFQVFAVLLRRSGIYLHCAETLERADFLMTATGATVLLTEPQFADGTWQEAAKMLASFHPRAALLIVAGEEDGELRTRALDRGAYGVLPKPLQMSALRDAVQGAHRMSQSRPIG